MLRSLLRAGLGRVLRLFFRRIEVAGLGRVPDRGPVIFAVNHPNALVDPLFLLCFAPRPVSFLAKAPLFRMPLIGWLARSLDSIPVHRRQDPGTDMAKNKETFSRARALLQRGGTLALAPEGASHSDPKLRPLKTGAARIALGACGKEPVRVVPVGLFYTQKATFRSAALMIFGEPIAVPPAPHGSEGEPPSELVDEVTRAMAAGLTELVAQADEHAALDLASRAERLVGASDSLPPGGLPDRLALRRRLLAGYRVLREQAPAELERILLRIGRLETAFRAADLEPADAALGQFAPAAVAAALARFVGRVIAFLPLAIPGIVLHYPGYRLIGLLARRVAGGRDDVLATAKIVGAAVVFPVTWLATGLAVGWVLGWPFGVLAALVAPLAGYAGLRLVERFDRLLTATQAFGFYLFEREHFTRLAGARDELRADLLRLAERFGV